MRYHSAAFGLALLTLLPARLSAQQGWEAGLGGLVTIASNTFAGGGASAALRRGSFRIGLGVLVGGEDGRVRERAELLAQFLLEPSGRGGTPYAFGGVAGVTGSDTRGYAVVGLGWEWHPSGRSGVFVEAGAGGGARIAAGIRWRRLR